MSFNTFRARSRFGIRLAPATDAGDPVITTTRRFEMPYARLVLGGLLVLLVLPTAAHAKKNVHDWQNVIDLDVDTKVAVRTVTGQVHFGYPSRVTADEITLELTFESAVLPGRTTSFGRTIPKSEIAEVRKAKASRWKSALVGAAIGAGIAAAIGGIGEATSGHYEDKGKITLVMAGVGAEIGAVAGAARPFDFLKGKKIYQAP
jgi:hypothetical protein